MTADTHLRVRRGMSAQLAARKVRMDAGETPLGWKVAFSTPAAMARLGTSAPLVGFLTSASVIPSNGVVSLAGWSKPAAEPEIAVHMGKDLPAGADDATALAAVAGLSPAIELADVSLPPENIEALLETNIYHRCVVLGSPQKRRSGGDVQGLIGRILQNGVEVARVADPEAATGKLLNIVRSVADELASAGEILRAGDIIITGSITPPIFLESGDASIVFELDPVDTVSVRFSQ